MKSWTLCCPLESVVLMGSLCFLLHRGTIFTNAQSQQSEEIFEEGYTGPGSIPFSDYKEDFCKFMRPRGWVYRDYSWIKDADIDLSFLGKTVEADIVRCQYSTSFSATYIEKHNYARGPNGKYYDMVESPTSFGHWAIRRRVWRPDDDHEKLFYDQYIENGRTAVKLFIPLPERFCFHRTPDYAEAFASGVAESKWIKMIEYKSGSFIKVELCECRYKLSDGSYEYTYYGHSPDNEYYEVRAWNFVHNYNNDEWVIWGKANI